MEWVPKNSMNDRLLKGNQNQSLWSWVALFTLCWYLFWSLGKFEWITLSNVRLNRLLITVTARCQVQPDFWCSYIQKLASKRRNAHGSEVFFSESAPFGSEWKDSWKQTLNEFLATAESPELLEDENQSVWLKKFIEGYYQWKGRRFHNSRYPLYSYFVIKGVSKDSK